MSELKIQPLADRVVLKPLTEEKSKVIVIAKTGDEEKPERGEVVAVGPGKKNDKGELVAMTVKVGDKVLFAKYTPNEIEIDGEEYLVVDEKDILAILQ